MFEISFHKRVHGGRVVALNRKFVSTSFSQIVNILRKYFGKEHEISTLFEIYFRQIDKVKKYYSKKYEKKFDDYRKINKQHFENYIKKKLPSLPISKELNKFDKSDLLVSSDYSSLYPFSNGSYIVNVARDRNSKSNKSGR